MKYLILISAFFSFTLNAQNPIFANAKAKSATVYYYAVELTHEANVNLPVGTSEVIIKNVANSLNESTVQIAAPTNITILSVQFSNANFNEKLDEQSPEIKKIKDSILVKTKELARLRNAVEAEQATIALLDSNRQVFGWNTGLAVAELMKMVEYYKNKRLDLANNIDLIEEKQRKVQEALNKWNDKLQDAGKSDEAISPGKLVLQIMNDKAGNVPLEISYLSNTASWTPFYDLRAESVTAPINMVYKAQVVQNSGIDWKKIKLSLSSGMPNQNNQAPLLSAWRLVYGSTYNYYNQNNRLAKDSRGGQMTNKIQSVQVDDREKGIYAEPNISNDTKAPDIAIINNNQLNVSFDIDLPYDILSNGKVHSVTLKEIKLPVFFKYYAVPKLDKEAFLLAELSDYSKYNLLPGEANIIFEGLYVGKTFIDPNQTTDTLNLSMGRDKKISIKREKVVDKSGSKLFSSSKSQTFTFDLTVRNGKKDAIDLLLKDQYPLSSDKDIEIELLQSDNAKVNTESGILTWFLKLAPNETKKIRISYSVKYPKDKVISNL
jgi:uncharacterized protein (TIGR02231 family)